MNGKILVVDDEKLICWSLQKDLAKQGYEVLTAQSLQEGLTLFEREPIDLVLLDIRLPDGDGKELLTHIKKQDSHVAVIMITADDDIRTAVQCMRAGAYTYVRKPFEFDELRLDIGKALEEKRLRERVMTWDRQAMNKYDFSNIMCESPQMKHVLDLVKQVVRSEASTVLLEGESGTGKDLIAGAIHYASPRAVQPFVSINCASIPDALLESELFGYEKGAFTDAKQRKKGLVEEAAGGTLFLDEIGDMPKGLQAKLLHLIDQKKFRKIGGVKELEADIRIIAATHKELTQEVKEGRFREDLYYRLHVIPIHLPPLREHVEDIPALVTFFIAHFNREFRKSIEGILPEAMEVLMQHHWPGNVRELRNLVERAMILNTDTVIKPTNLPAEIECRCSLKDAYRLSSDRAPSQRLTSCIVGLPLESIEEQAVILALQHANGNQSQAAKLLNIGRDALRYKMRKFHLSTGDKTLTASE